MEIMVRAIALVKVKQLWMFLMMENDFIAPSINIENLDETLSTNHLVDILKKMDDKDLDAIFSSINSLNNDEKEYLLNQIEA